ncbi:MAG: peptide ABC transporter substrate-binding protein [Simkaniaceae bacterium]|nr:peptide ABC transporter substrate-binding protein [Simkaniaceae bacterium]
MFPAPKKEKQTLPFMLQKPYKEVVKEKVGHLYAGEEKELDDTIQRKLDFWFLTFGIEFLTKRCPEYIAKIVVESSDLTRILEWDISTHPNRRASAFVTVPSTIVSTFSSKDIAGCLLGIQLESSHERVAREQIKDAIEACGVGFELLDAFYRCHLDKSSVDIFYFEIGRQENEVEHPMDLSLFEKTFLKKIETRIQVLVPTLFMQRNEEEMMKNLLVLRKEAYAVQDTPQVMILYDQHTTQEITFTIILARVKKKDDPRIQDVVKLNKENENYIQGQVYSLEDLPEERTIEGNIFQIRLKNLSRFQKKNGSIDYFLSRKQIVACLQASLGEIRDYNGGLFFMQDKKLEELKKLFPEEAAHSFERLKTFFYSLRPIEEQATLPIELLTHFFKLFQGLIAEEQLQLLTETCDLTLIIAFKCVDKKKFFTDEEPLLKSKISYETIVCSKWSYGNSLFKGFILSFDTINDLQKYEKEVRERLTQMSSCKAPQEKILYINDEFNRFDFDPRLSGTNQSIMINNLLFEGLTRINKKKEVTMACAESYQLSSDEKTYTFQLKELRWSNGEPLIADHFEYAWKKILAPDSKTIFDYPLHVILNAQPAKEGKVPLDAVGVKALSNTQLEIQLNHPVPYFLELLAHPLFSPIYPDSDAKDPNWACGKHSHFVCNGPFRPQVPRPFCRSEFGKNPYFWNKEAVVLERLSILDINTKQALKLFKNQQLDCLGTSFGISKQKFIEYSDGISDLPVSKVFWCCFNIKSFPLSNKKIRQAFFYAVNRQKIIKGIRSKTEPAYSPLSKETTSFSPTKYVEIENKEKAKQFFAQGLRELGISKKAFPKITITLFDTDISRKVMCNFKKQIKESLGIQLSLLKLDPNEALHKLERGDYEISALRWNGWINDPLYTLELFNKQGNGTHFTNWENPQYQSLIKMARTVKNQQKKSEILSKAEKVLIDDYVVLSLFYEQDIEMNNFKFEIDHLNQLNVIA